MLLTVGERGYGRTTVMDLLDKGGFSRGRLYRVCEGKEDCFVRAYEAAAERLCGDILSAGQGGEGWREGFRAALTELLRFVAAQPLHAKALALEVRAARGQAWAKHEEVVGRLAHALDSARRETGSRHSAPPITSKLMVGAIEASLLGLIVSGEAARAPSLLPDLTHFVVLNYFGEEAAWGT